MEYDFIKVYKNPKYQQELSGNINEQLPPKTNPLETNNNSNGITPPSNSQKNSQTITGTKELTLEDLAPTKKTNDNYNILEEFNGSVGDNQAERKLHHNVWAVLPPYNNKKIYTLNNYSSGIGELTIRIESLDNPQIIAMMELTSGEQLFIPNDSIKRYGVSINNNALTINLSHIKELRRLSVVTLDNTNGVMVAENSTLDWVKHTQLNNLAAKTILLNLYNIFGKIVIREGLEYYSKNLRELAHYNSYNKINWLNENTPI